MELSNIPLAELKQILESIPSEIKRREMEEKRQVLKELKDFARKFGFTLEQLMSENGATIDASLIVKYRHPNNAKLAWSGRGRRPKWMMEFIAAGGSIEQLTV